MRCSFYSAAVIAVLMCNQTMAVRLGEPALSNLTQAHSNAETDHTHRIRVDPTVTPIEKPRVYETTTKSTERARDDNSDVATVQQTE